MDAKTRKCDGVAGRKYPSLLEGFTDGHIINGSYETSCINRKGFIMFLSYGSHSTGIRPIRPIRSIRVRIETSRGQEVYLCLSPCASTARGFYCFCLMTQIGVQEVQKVQLVQIRSIRPIRGRETSKGQPFVLLLSNSPA